MENTTVLTFTMTAYAVMENYKGAMLFVFLLLYVIIITLNSLLIAVIRQNKALHQPMNVFTCVLSMNGIYGSTALLPAVMAVLMSDTYEISVEWCKAQVYFLHTYASAEFCILAVMGYDRYVAICYPLRYCSIMSHSKICKLTALAILYPMIMFGGFYSLTLMLSFCKPKVPKLYCVNMELVKNSCHTAPYISIAGLVILLAFVWPQVGMILFSYVQIARVCRKLKRQAQGSALKTCIPHLLSLSNYTIGSLFEIFQSRFNIGDVAAEVRIFLSLYFIIIPSIFNPILYGMGIHLVRVHILKLLIRQKILPTK